MDRITDYGHLKDRAVDWIKSYADENGIKSLVIGVSGGIDSAVVSTLCAETDLPVFVLGMPILQNKEQESLSSNHLAWLVDKYANVVAHEIELTPVFQSFCDTLSGHGFGSNNLALANSRSRLRMVTLYQVAGSTGGIVVGTGNKVEDYGVGFYTKYGDGGVDIAPIADLYKTEVWTLGKYLGVDPSIIDAPPTDGLWDDSRTDEDQLGATYVELEQAMESSSGPAVEVLKKFNTLNKHKMIPIPTFKL
ncbi:NAD(+) synthase [Pseudomonadales bacterium]|nr:NAD(+) synthase [Pseudomonadales bacterium]